LLLLLPLKLLLHKLWLLLHKASEELLCRCYWGYCHQSAVLPE
jgi:hypothetical protein